MSIAGSEIQAGETKPGRELLSPEQTKLAQQILMPHFDVLRKTYIDGGLDEADFKEAEEYGRLFEVAVSRDDDYDEGPAQLRGAIEGGFIVIPQADFLTYYTDETSQSAPHLRPNPGTVVFFDEFLARPTQTPFDSLVIKVEATSVHELAGRAKVTRKSVFDYDSHMHTIGVADIMDTGISLTYERLKTD